MKVANGDCLTAHEATTEKVVHQLVVHDGTTAEQRAAA